MKIVAGILLILLLTVAAIAIAVVPRKDTHKHKPPKDMTNLAARINHACKKGYAVSDWTTGDEFDPVPAGTVKVTCSRTKAPYDLYYVAVAR